MWKCNECNRSFSKNNQSHSCVVYPLENHFKNKENQQELFNYYIDYIKKNVGEFIIEAVPCCIHLVSTYTFSALWIFKDKIRIDFMLPEKLTSKRFVKIEQPSKNRFVHYVDIKSKDDIDQELINWLKASYFLKS